MVTLTDTHWALAASRTLARIAGLGSLLLALASVSQTAAAATVDGKPALQGAEPGLYIWRTYAGRWQVRLRTTSEARLASLFDANGDITGIRPVNAGNIDALSQPDMQSLVLNLATKGPRTKGGSFLVDGDALCLRLSQNSTSKVFLGRNKVPASSPSDLTDNGACNNPAQLAPDGRKFNGGHYTGLMPRKSDYSAMITAVKPGMRGIRKSYQWRELEPSPGVYDFSGIETDLGYVSQWGLQLIIFISDKTFSGGNPLPDYLAGVVAPNRKGGYTSLRWDPVYIERYKALLTALADRVDAHPNFEGISTQETAPSLDSQYLQGSGYSPEKYRDALIEVLQHAGQQFETSRIFWNMNFLPGNQFYLSSVASAVTSSGVALGGPDVLPDDAPLVRLTYPLYDQFKGRMAMWTQVEPSVYEHEHADPTFPTRFWTPDELFQWARVNQNINYIFWSRITWRRYSDSYNWYDALPVISATPNF